MNHKSGLSCSLKLSTWLLLCCVSFSIKESFVKAEDMWCFVVIWFQVVQRWAPESETWHWPSSDGEPCFWFVKLIFTHFVLINWTRVRSAQFFCSYLSWVGLGNGDVRDAERRSTHYNCSPQHGLCAKMCSKSCCTLQHSSVSCAGSSGRLALFLHIQ